jgi:hypothetical protein
MFSGLVGTIWLSLTALAADRALGDTGRVPAAQPERPPAEVQEPPRKRRPPWISPPVVTVLMKRLARVARSARLRRRDG